MRGSPVIELQTVLSGHTAFSAPETKTDKEENKQQPVAILAQGHWCRARKKKQISPSYQPLRLSFAPAGVTCDTCGVTFCFAVLLLSVALLAAALLSFALLSPE